MVFLAGKDEQGKTIYIEDGIAHRHKTKGEHLPQQQQPATTNSSSTVGTTGITEGSTITAIKVINAKLDRIINLLVELR